MTPPAIGIKVGNGTDTLQALPWIQAMAGDVYAWAKAANPPSASSIAATRTNSSTSATTSTTVEAWLQSLTNDLDGLSGGSGSISTQITDQLNRLDVDNDDTSSLAHHITGFNPAKTLATLIETDGYISATFQDILIAQSQVSGLGDALAAKAPLASPNLTGTPTAPTADAGTNTTQIATTAFVKNAVDTATAGLTGAMHFKGSVQTLPTATDSATFAAYEAGDVVLGPNDKEYVYNKGANAAGSSWVELGDETSFAVKGSITDSDIASNAGIAQSKIAGLTSDLSLLAPKANPTFTGTVTVPTPSNNTDAATKGYVDAANTTYSFAAGDNDGEIKVTPYTNNTAGTPISVKPKNLHKIATSGSIYDIEEGSNTTTTGSTKYLIFDCGTATTLID